MTLAQCVPERPELFEVTSVRNADPSSRPLCSSTHFREGDTVHQATDREKRDLNSRGHVVGLAVCHLASSIPDVTELKAQHYPDSAFVDFQKSISHLPGDSQAP